ncbi:MAG: radical SAM protein [Planctomycetota bacterium]
MSVLLVRPPLSDRKRAFFSCQFPLNLCYLASSLIEHCHDISVFDFEAGGTVESFISFLKEKKPELIGFSCLTSNITAGAELASMVRSILPASINIVGGHHASAIPERTLSEFSQFDICCIGEGEDSIVQLAESVSRKNNDYSSIPGISFRNSDGEIKTNCIVPLRNVDTIPFPARELLNISNYHGQSHRGFSRDFLRITEITTSRGCNWKCSFCAQHVVSGGRRRSRSAENVIAEIQECVNKFGFNHFNIHDDCFIEKNEPRRAIEIAEEFRRHKVTFNCNVRVDAVTKELLFTLAKLGLTGISFGVESGSEHVLEDIRKKTAVKQIREAFMWAKSAKIPHVEATVMIGFPEENEAEICQTADLIYKINPTDLMVSIAVPYPGTKLFKDFSVEKHVVKKELWKEFKFYDTSAFWKAEGILPEKLSKLQRRIMRKFYFHPAGIMNRLLHIRSSNELKYYISAGMDFLKDNMISRRTCPPINLSAGKRADTTA